MTIVGRRDDVLRGAAEALNAEAGAERVTAVAFDCADPVDVRRLADPCPDPLDVLVLNAGGTISTPELVAQRTTRIPMRRSGSVEEVAGLVAHLASPDGGFTTGQVIGIHGGTVLARL